MDRYTKKGDAYVKAHPTDDEKAILWHLAKFMLLKWGIIVSINRLAKTLRVLDEKRHMKDLLDRIDEVAAKMKEMGS